MARDDDIPPAARTRIAALAAEMAEYGRGREAPARAVMAMLGDRWTTLILLVLATGHWRSSPLRRMLGELSDERAISQRVLTLKLRALERDGFVGRGVSGDVPPRVTYWLTALGEELAGEARRMVDWLNARNQPIHAARRAFDAEDAKNPRSLML